MELLRKLAEHCQVVLEANFRPKSSYERSRIRALGGGVLEVYCSCPAEEAARRFALRASNSGHHPAHAAKNVSPDLLAEYDAPVGIGAVLEVDTGRPMDISHLVGRIREHWSLKPTVGPLE